MSNRRWVFVLLVLGCTETTSPPEPRDEAIRLAAASPTSQTAAAGALVKDIPTVIAYNADGSPVAGAVVTFAMEAGAESGANIEHSVDTTDADGVARVRFWKVGTKTSVKNILSAKMGSAEPVFFSTAVLPGPVNNVVKIAGDNQIVEAFHPASISPRVQVTDFYNNPVPATVVTFEVRLGGGTIAEDEITTDSLGIVTAVGWTAGSKGNQTLQVKAGVITTSFHALALDSVDPCSQVTELSPFATVTMTLPNAGCVRDGRNYTTVYLTTPNAGSWTLEMRSTNFDSYLELRDMNGKLIAANDNADGAKDSRISAIIPAGTYKLIAASNTTGVGGGFRISTNALTQTPNCGETFVSRGSDVRAIIHELKCNGTSLGYTDLYRLHLDSGDSILVGVCDWSYSGSAAVLVDQTGKELPSEHIETTGCYYTRRYMSDKTQDVLVKVLSTEDWAEYFLAFN